MNQRLQVLYMQTRLLRLAAEKWQVTVAKANEIFTRYGVYRFLEDCFELFHVEGDQAILEEIGQYLAHKGLAL